MRARNGRVARDNEPNRPWIRCQKVGNLRWEFGEPGDVRRKWGIRRFGGLEFWDLHVSDLFLLPYGGCLFLFTLLPSDAVSVSHKDVWKGLKALMVLWKLAASFKEILLVASGVFQLSYFTMCVKRFYHPFRCCFGMTWKQRQKPLEVAGPTWRRDLSGLGVVFLGSWMKIPNESRGPQGWNSPAWKQRYLYIDWNDLKIMFSHVFLLTMVWVFDSFGVLGCLIWQMRSSQPVFTSLQRVGWQWLTTYTFLINFFKQIPKSSSTIYSTPRLFLFSCKLV